MCLQFQQFVSATLREDLGALVVQRLTDALELSLLTPSRTDRAPRRTRAGRQSEIVKPLRSPGVLKKTQVNLQGMKPVEVLLVEDNAGDTLLIQQTLAECPIPVKLHIARDGEQAFQMLDDPDFSPGLIILDLNIPRIPGSAVLERYHSTKTPIVIFSSSWNDAEIERALKLGAREFARKPTDLQTFGAVVCGIVERWALREETDSTATVARS